MALTINHNLMTENVARNLTDRDGAVGTMMHLLSTGRRSNFPTDNATNLSVQVWTGCNRFNGMKIIATYMML